ncbi:uncharacterized protein LOC117104890 [Anneissia japonica]|uniref:uncharacterized protein LOC117104890 n=1 Tax=Anneissia japonica TaxID=1529436 RepID=UPI0014258BFC|nr:uncharacterized protein LOC117104890 [Anneissia japonica]
MEKIHVAPLSSNSIPALFAVPTGSGNGMRLCKRIIFIKNGMSYSNYVPITQVEADSKNMFGVARVVNLLDEKHKFKRHMVIKNWINHVKAAKGAITAVASPIKKPTPSGPASSFVQIPVSTSESVTPNSATLGNSIKKLQSIAPASMLSPLEVSKVSNKSDTVSTPKIVSKDSNHPGKNVQTKQQQVVKVLPVKHHEQGGPTNPSNIKITSVFSLAEKGGLYFPKNISQSAVASTQLNALKQIAGHVIHVKRQTEPQQASNVKYQLPNSNSAQPLEKALPSGITNLNVQRGQTSKSSIGIARKSSSKELIPSSLQPSFVTLKQSCIKEKAGTNLEYRLDTDIKEDEPVDDTKSRMSNTKPFNRKSSAVRRSQRRKTATRPYSPSQSYIKSQNSQTVKMERNNNSPINNTASIQILKGVKHALNENTLRRNRVLKISLPKILSLTQEHGVKKKRNEFNNQSSSESFEVSEQLMSVTEDVFIKKEPLDASDDNDNVGYLNSFMKEQQFIMESFMSDSKSMHFPLVMIKKEPLSDDEDIPNQEPVPSKIIKEEPLSDEDEECTLQFQADQQCLNANSDTEGPYQNTLVEQKLVAVPSSREDRVKQLKDRIKEKQNALALFRKRPRISLIDEF